MKLSTDAHTTKVAAGLALIGVLVFGASFNDPFHFDDVLILNDSNVANPARWHHFLNPLHLRQLTFFSFYLNHLVNGTNPAGYHVVNVFLHIANAALLLFLLSRYVERWVAVCAAVIFLVHPIQTEPVHYVYQRSILLACFFSLLGLTAVAERRTWLAGLFFFLAFESKESAVAVPLLVAFLTGTAVLPDRGSGPAWRKKTLIIGLAALAGVAALAVLDYRHEPTVGLGATAEITPLTYFWTETRVIYTYLRLLFFPHPQSLEYDFEPPSSALPLIGLIVIVAAAWIVSRQPRFRVPAWCALSFFILLAPTSSIVPSVDAAFEHRLYLPMLAFSVFVASIAAMLPRRTWIVFAISTVLITLTVRRGNVWAGNIALWEDAAQQAPKKARVWFNLGGAYLDVDAEKARAALLRGLELRPGFPEALYNLGIIEQRRNNLATAASFYERATGSAPEYWPAWNNLGNTLFVMGETERALECFERTLSLNRNYWPAQYNIAILFYTNGQFEKAAPRLKTVLDWQPDFYDARRLLAESLNRMGRRVEAERELKKLEELAATESRHTPTMILAPTRPQP